MGADIEAVLREEGCQPPPAVKPHHVRVTFNPYSYSQVRTLMVGIKREFPKQSDKGRWSFVVSDEGELNVWILDFYFRDIKDAIIFGLKYSR